MCQDFADTGAGKLIGPDGNEMDTESFLSDLHVSLKSVGLSASTTPCEISTGSLLFRVVTQQYGKGIVSVRFYNYNLQMAWSRPSR